MKRIVIETNEKVVTDAIKEWSEANPEKKKKALLTIISDYDRDKFTNQMNEIHEALKRFQDSKIDSDILIAYIRSKNVPLATIKAVLRNEREFFEKLGVL